MREADRGPQLSVPIDAELKARLEAAAAREDRPVASYVRRIVMKVLDAPSGKEPQHDDPGDRRGD
ncbi:MAG: hypothetical protein WAV38_27090 [Xanthobacteraceae bacterium]